MKKYYCTTHKRTFWMLGYFSRNVQKIYEMAQQFHKETGTDFDKIQIDEILSSRRFKSMYIMYSTEPNQENKSGGEEMENVYQFFRD